MDRTNVALLEGELREHVTATQFWSIELFPSFGYYWERNREYFYTNWRLQRLRALLHAIQALETGVRNGEIRKEIAGPHVLRLLKELDYQLSDEGLSAWNKATRRLMRLFS